MIVDTHAHLDSIKNFEIPEDRIVFTVGYVHKANVEAVRISRQHTNVYPILGIAPIIQREEDLSMLDNWIDFIRNNKPLAIGEIGLDYHWGKTEDQLKKQRTCFEKMLELAEELNLPVSIHSRDAEEDIVDRLCSWKLGGIMHCFRGNEKQAEKAVESGFMISVSPVKSRKTKKVIKNVGLDSIVVETDAPYIGKSLDDIFASISIVSEVLSVSKREVIDTTEKNARCILKW